MAPARPWPLVQGELDGLCGLYSIINSLTWGLYSLQVIGHRPRQQCSPLGQREIEELFLSLITRLTRKHGTRSVVDGISSLELARLLRHSAAWLSAKRDLRANVRAPVLSPSAGDYGASVPGVCQITWLTPVPQRSLAWSGPRGTGRW